MAFREKIQNVFPNTEKGPDQETKNFAGTARDLLAHKLVIFSS